MEFGQYEYYAQALTELGLTNVTKAEHEDFLLSFDRVDAEKLEEVFRKLAEIHDLKYMEYKDHENGILAIEVSDDVHALLTSNACLRDNKIMVLFLTDE